MESETFVLRNPYLDQTLDDSDIERLEDHFEVNDLIVSHPMSFDFHISFDWPCLGPLPSPFRDVGLYFGDLDHTQCFMLSYSQVIAKPLTSASNFACTHLSFDWIESLISSREP